ncbi:transmembrane protein 107 isoform X1 [Eschrichtius robustus]|uniref:transmembrane protein 107 isoform X1 n=1 Tax=Eschrichtius robustus TaxID=9764 RepID=UPI0035BF7A73
MGRISGLVPSRFLTLLAHLVVVITLFWSRDSNIQACLPLKFTPEEYEKQDMQLVAALSVTLALFAVELAGFFSGVSMFNSTQSLISIGAHCSASVALSFFIFERWECTTYWYIFVFCRCYEGVVNLPRVVGVLLLWSCLSEVLECGWSREERGQIVCEERKMDLCKVTGWRLGPGGPHMPRSI